MKLRNRTTRVISNIKQEDCKPIPNATEKSTSILASDASSYDLIIKQEDTKDGKALLEQHGKIAALLYIVVRLLPKDAESNLSIGTSLLSSQHQAQNLKNHKGYQRRT
ncbi:hypothetical protein MUCCIDRAFT_108488 [Mucor lusitanicus CBS 277.49]|uniref:Uncharacterized protein n=1 Tax=Mucor lusitanicus CBS 277.49 TaxID=747725 RepID=A0A162REX0_MUCCL|nr:hypothetical protein MUCCIDRAFT_108488 [Mucor lusitanicus CBS 277.49]